MGDAGVDDGVIDVADDNAAAAVEQAARGDSGQPVRFHGSVTDDEAVADIILDQSGQTA